MTEGSASWARQFWWCGGMKVLHLTMWMMPLFSTAPVIFAHADETKTKVQLRPYDQQIVALGKQLYATNCASCHGKNLEGEPNWQTPKADLTMPAPPHNKRGHTWHHNDKLLFDLTKFGLAKYLNQPTYKTSMPFYDGALTDEDIIAVLSYIKSTWPEQVRTRHDKLNAQNGN